MFLKPHSTRQTDLQLIHRGPGLDNALEIFKELKKENIKIISDVHEINHISLFQDCIDIQIPAFLCRQTDLIKEACQTINH